MKPGRIILLIVVAIFLATLAVNFSENASVYTNFNTARETGKQVHIVGEWVQREQSAYDPQRDLFTFYLKDSTQVVERVHYYDPKPINFETAERIVLVGGYADEGFVADKIIMKCPSKYEETDITAGEPKTEL